MDQRADDLQQTIAETRNDIAETRASMSDKLELLEERVRDTLEETKTAVDDIVENVKGTVDETVGAVKETVDGAKSTVENIVENVKESMDDTVAMVKKSFDLRYQVDQHPWLMLGASVVTGSVLARFLSGGHESRRNWDSTNTNQKGPHVTDTTSGTGLYTVSGNEESTGSSQFSAASQPQQRQSWGAALGGVQEEVVDVMKGAVLGTVMGTVREMIRQNMPSVMGRFDTMMNNLSKKLGTEIIEPHTTPEQTTTNGHSPVNTPATSGSYASYGSTPGGEPYGRAQ